MLSISRFLDPPQSMGQSNCSLAAIAALPENAAFRNDLQKQLNALVPVWAKGIRTWRHKKLSHSDLATVLGTNVLPDIPFSEIKTLVDGITAFVREIEHRLNHRDISYRCSLTGWVPQVLKYLALGIQKRDDQLKSLSIRVSPTEET